MPYNILYLHETGKFAGAENSLLNLAVKIDRTKFNPIFACPDNGLFPDKLKEAKIAVYSINYPSLRGMFGVLSTIKKIRKILKEREINLIHSNSIRTHIYGIIAGWRQRIPVIWHQRNLITDEPIDLDRLFSFLPDKIICNSHAVADRFLKNGQLPGKVIVIHNGVDTMIFSPSQDKQKVREELNIKPDEIVVGIAARLDWCKGHESFLRAAKILLTDMSNNSIKLRFLIVGGTVFDEDSAVEKQLMDLVRDLGIRDKVIFTGFREDMPQVYGAMDIFVLPSKAEACGRAIIEAMSCGLPVIGADSGGTPEIIQDAVTGFLVKALDAGMLADKIAYLINNPDIAKKMGVAGRRRAEEHFNLEKNVRLTEDVYSKIIKARSSSG